MDVDGALVGFKGRDLILTLQAVEHFRGHEWSSWDISTTCRLCQKKERTVRLPKVEFTILRLPALCPYPFDSFLLLDFRMSSDF